MRTYGKLLELGYVLASAVSPHTVWRHYQDLLKNQYLAKEEVEKIQWTKFVSLLKHAYEQVPFYRRKFKEAGICPEDIRTTDDMQKLPFTTRPELSVTSPENVIAEGFSVKDLTLIKTSGTSEGKPFRLYIDTCGLNRKYALLLRNYSFLNWKFGKKIMSLWNKAHDDYRPLKERSLIKVFVYALAHRKKFLPPFQQGSRLSNGDGAGYFQRINAFRPHLLEGDGFMLYHIGRFLAENSLFIRCVEAISVATGPTTPFIRKRIGEMFGAPVFNNYGPHEMEGVACECSEHQGLHQSIDSYLIEFIKNERIASDNELSEIVLTDLDNFAMPLIRYRIGDLVKAGSFACTCKRTLPLMHDIEGRVTDVIKTDRGIFTENCLQTFFSEFNLENQFQIVQHNPQRLTVTIMQSGNLKPCLLETMELKLRELLGEDTRIMISVCDSIHCEASGKFRLVKSAIH